MAALARVSKISRYEVQKKGAGGEEPRGGEPVDQALIPFG